MTSHFGTLYFAFLVVVRTRQRFLKMENLLGKYRSRLLGCEQLVQIYNHLLESQVSFFLTVILRYNLLLSKREKRSKAATARTKRVRKSAPLSCHSFPLPLPQKTASYVD